MNFLYLFNRCDLEASLQLFNLQTNQSICARLQWLNAFHRVHCLLDHKRSPHSFRDILSIQFVILHILDYNFKIWNLLHCVFNMGSLVSLHGSESKNWYFSQNNYLICEGSTIIYHCSGDCGCGIRHAELHSLLERTWNLLNILTINLQSHCCRYTYLFLSHFLTIFSFFTSIPSLWCLRFHWLKRYLIDYLNNFPIRCQHRVDESAGSYSKLQIRTDHASIWNGICPDCL